MRKNILFFAILPLFFVAVSVISGPFFFFSDEAAAQSPSNAEAKPIKNLFDPAKIDRNDPVAECGRAIRENRLYREALDVLQPWTLDPKTNVESLGNGATLAVECLNRLNQTSQFDAYIEALVAAHPNNGALLATAARLYQNANHWGCVIGGEFVRGSGDGRNVSVEGADRVRAIQLCRQAEGQMQKASAAERARFYRDFAALFQSDPNWKMQILTDLDLLAEPTEPEYVDRSFVSAPVDENGNPVFYSVPESFEAAENDGQRWRWCLAKAVEEDSASAPEVYNTLADFLRGQFGVSTLAGFNYFFRHDNDQEPAEGTWSLETLADNETVAKLASGIKRFTLPDDQNYLGYYKKIYDTADANQRYNAGMSLADEYVCRRQYVKAAEIYKSLMPFEVEKKFSHPQAKNQYEQIVGNWGAFDAVESKAAGSETTLTWRYRNAKRVTFTARAVNVKRFLDDIKAYLKKLDGKAVKDVGREKIDVENIGFRLMNDDAAKAKYLGDMKAEWSVELDPDAEHRTCKTDVAFPVTDSGAYLVCAETDGGNSDAILVWLNDTALVQKPMDEANLWFVADTLSGSPVPNANLDFFGWKLIHKEGWAGFGDRVLLKTKTESNKTDANGLFVEKHFCDADGSYRLLVTASAPKEGGERFAFFGFGNFWSNSRSDEHFMNDKAYFISDRPVYRPGDQVDFKFYVGRAQYDLPETQFWADQKVWLVVNDPTGTEIVSKETTLDDGGGFAEALETKKDAKLGIYRFAVLRKKDGDCLGAGTIRLEEYKKPEFEVTVELPSEPVKLGDTFSAKISANYFFGAPVQNAAVKYTVTRTNKNEPWFPVRPWDWFYGNGYGWLAPDFDWYPGWKTWGILRPCPTWRPWNRVVPEVVAQNEVEMGDDGTVDVKIDSSLAAAIWPDDDHEYKIDAEVTDLSRRTILGSGSIPVARSPFKVYCWLDRGFIEPNQQVTATIQTRRVDGRPVTGTATAKVYQIACEPDEKGTLQPIETEVGGEELTIGSDGIATWNFTAGEVGQYKISVTVTDKNGNRREGGTIVSVRGSGRADGKAFRSGPLEIVPEKGEYESGETVRLSLRSSNENAAGLLFLRSVNGICSMPEIVKLDGTQGTYEFTLTDADRPNIFVEALTVADGRLYEQQREIPVVPAERVVNVEITPSAENYKPDEKASATIRLTDTDGQPIVGDIVAAVCDRSVEYISGGSNVPDVRSYFWDWKRSSAPHHADNLENISEPLAWPKKKILERLGMFDYEAYGGGRRIEARGRAVAQKMGRGLSDGSMVYDRLEENVEMMANFAPMANDGFMMMSVPCQVKNEMAAEYADMEVSTGSAAGVEPIVRQNFADTALWVGRLTTNADGEAKIELNMPENLTAWKIHVWSFAPGTRVGEGTAEVITRKDLMIRMQRPRFLTQTDTVTLSANVHNYLDAEKTVTVSLDVASADEKSAAVLKPLGENRAQTVTIPSGGEARVDWQVAAAGLGKVQLVMKAITDTESDAVAETLGVQIHGILKQEAWSGMIAANESAESSVTLHVPAERLLDQTKLTVQFSPTLAGSMIDALPYLNDYPYGCTEQTLNRFLPTVLTLETLHQLGVSLESIKKEHANLNTQQLGDGEERMAERFNQNPIYDSAAVHKMAADGVKRLAEMQCSDGGWGWFSGFGERSSAHLTALVTRGLLLAQNADVAVDSAVAARGIAWLEKYLAAETVKLLNGETWDDQRKNESSRWKNHADADDSLVFNVLMTAGGSLSEDTAANLARMKEYLWRDRTELSLYANALYALALCTESIDTNRERIELIVRMFRQYLAVDEKNQTAWLDTKRADCWANLWRWWSWDGSDIETQAAFLRLLVRVEPSGNIAPRLVKYLLNNRKNGSYWNSTRDTALVLEAFGEYIKASGEAAGEMTVEVLVDGEVRKTCAVTPENLFVIDNILEMSELSDGEHTVSLRRTGSGPLYWNAYLQNFTLEDFIEKTGLEVNVERRYWLLTEDTDAAANVVGSRGQAVSQRVKKWKRSPIENLAAVKSGDQVEVELLIESKNDYDSLLIEDHKAAGFEPVDLTSGYNGNKLGAYVEFRDDRVSFFLSRLDRGTYSLTYRLRAETPGKFSALPATILGMYAPELAGNSDEMKIEIRE